MVTDPIGDLLIQIKNASLARKQAIELPHSRLKMAVAKILSQEGYIGSVEKSGNEPKYVLRIGIKYQDTVPAITDLKRMSKPGLRSYVNKDEIPSVIGGMGTAILSTSRGIMTGKEAKKRKLGGELLCIIW